MTSESRKASSEGNALHEVLEKGSWTLPAIWYSLKHFAHEDYSAVLSQVLILMQCTRSL